MELHSPSSRGQATGKVPPPGGKHLPFLATKIVAPRCLGLIDRPRLLTMASHLPGKRLAVIKAPAGFGKTSLAAGWAEWFGRRGSSVAWFTIDPDDDEPSRFLFYVTQAIRRAASEAMVAGYPLTDIARAEARGKETLRRALRAESLKLVERTGDRARDAQAEHYRAIARATRLGLPMREIALAAHVTHGTIRAITNRLAAQAVGSDVADHEP